MPFQEVAYDNAGSRKLGKNFKKIIPLYRYFGRGCTGLDWSDVALFAMYEYETHGAKKVKSNNGFAYGKMMMDISITMWKEDLNHTLWLEELYEDPNLPDWWIQKIMKG